MKRFYIAPRNVAFHEHVRDWAKNAERKFDARLLTGSAKMEAGDADVEFSIMDVIGIPWLEGSITCEQVEKALQRHASAKKIRVIINSPGGYCHEGVGIYNLFDRHPAEVEVEVIGEAASAASVIAMCGNKILMRRGTWMMIHPALTGAYGHAEDLRGAADYADVCTEGAIEIYVHRTGRTDEEVRALVKAPGTWLTAARARELGFADDIVEGDVAATEHEPVDEQADSQEIDVNINITSQRRVEPRSSLSTEARRLVHLQDFAPSGR